MEKKLVKSLKIDRFEDEVEIFFVDDKYYSVEYKGKEEYYTKDEAMAKTVGGVILFFFRSLKEGTELFSKQETPEEKWNVLLRFLNQESKNNERAREVVMGVYQTLSSYYEDSLEGKDQKQMNLKNSIRTKDNLMCSIHMVTALKDPREALTNFRRYQIKRNQFVDQNKIDMEWL